MQLTSVLGTGSRVLDVGVTHVGLARDLAAAGTPHYLGLVPPEQLARVRSEAPELAHRFHPLTSPALATRNSTDLLVLRPPYDRVLWSWGELAHVEHVAVPVGTGGGSAELRLATAFGRAAGRLRSRGRTTLGSQSFLLVAVPSPRPERARRYLSPVLGVSGLVEQLRASALQYVVLRWFEELPLLEPGEDLDVLAADADLRAFQDLLAQEPGTIPVDLYSETGLPGSAYRDVAYYPPRLARVLLDEAVLHASGARVPSPPTHLWSLAFHAVYHKGARSGIASALLPPAADPEHDYAGVLQALAAAQGLTLPPTLEELEDLLAAQGWRPPLDTVRRLAVHDPWLAARLPALHADRPASSEPPEPAVFLVRERALARVSLEEVQQTLRHYGFQPLLARALDDPARARCAAELRGGNWGRGPFPLSGGSPAGVVVAVHHGPRPPEGAVLAQYPRLSNVDVLTAKRAVRALVDSRTPPEERFNPLHSSDDGPEAWEYVECAVPEELGALRDAVRDLQDSYRTDVRVLRTLSTGRRAKVELVDGPTGPVVRKTFAHGFRDHLERELLAREVLGPVLDAVPELLDTGPSWFAMPCYADLLQDTWRRGGLLPLPLVREMVDVLRRVHELGYDVLDAKPQNFLLDPEDGLKLIDFEFLHRYAGTPPALVDSYCFVGVPVDFPGDAPVRGKTYDELWRRWTGLPLRVLVEGTPAEQQLHRALYRASPTAPGSPARRALAPLRPALRGARRRAARGFDRWVRYRAGSLPGGGA